MCVDDRVEAELGVGCTAESEQHRMQSWRRPRAGQRPPPRPAPPPEALFYLGSWASLEPLSRHTFFPEMEPAIS